MKRFAAFALLCALSCSQALAKGDDEVASQLREMPPTTDFQLERIGQPTAEIVEINPSPDWEGMKMVLVIFGLLAASLLAAELTSTGKEI